MHILLQSHFTGDWAKVDGVVCCEAGGFFYVSTLASRVGKPLVLIREAGKLPAPTFSVAKPLSYISSMASNDSEEERIEIERDLTPKGSSVVVLDDALSTGETLCAVLQLLEKAGISAEDINVTVVAEIPTQRGRELLRRRGFGKSMFKAFWLSAVLREGLGGWECSISGEHTSLLCSQFFVTQCIEIHHIERGAR